MYLLAAILFFAPCLWCGQALTVLLLPPGAGWRGSRLGVSLAPGLGLVPVVLFWGSLLGLRVSVPFLLLLTVAGPAAGDWPSDDRWPRPPPSRPPGRGADW